MNQVQLIAIQKDESNDFYLDQVAEHNGFVELAKKKPKCAGDFALAYWVKERKDLFKVDSSIAFQRPTSFRWTKVLSDFQLQCFVGKFIKDQSSMDERLLMSLAIWFLNPSNTTCTTDEQLVELRKIFWRNIAQLSELIENPEIDSLWRFLVEELSPQNRSELIQLAKLCFSQAKNYVVSESMIQLFKRKKIFMFWLAQLLLHHDAECENTKVIFTLLIHNVHHWPQSKFWRIFPPSVEWLKIVDEIHPLPDPITSKDYDQTMWTIHSINRFSDNNQSKMINVFDNRIVNLVYCLAQSNDSDADSLLRCIWATMWKTAKFNDQCDIIEELFVSISLLQEVSPSIREASKVAMERFTDHFALKDYIEKWIQAAKTRKRKLNETH